MAELERVYENDRRYAEFLSDVVMLGVAQIKHYHNNAFTVDNVVSFAKEAQRSFNLSESETLAILASVSTIGRGLIRS